jgi:hypothetical protein
LRKKPLFIQGIEIKFHKRSLVKPFSTPCLLYLLVLYRKCES